IGEGGGGEKGKFSGGAASLKKKKKHKQLYVCRLTYIATVKIIIHSSTSCGVLTDVRSPCTMSILSSVFVFFFFFSSRRRHTRFKCDWSSDVCSSDLFGLFLRSLRLSHDASAT